MIHIYLKEDTSGDHYGVSSNDQVVLAQLQDAGQQVRVMMSPEQARDFARRLEVAADRVEKARQELGSRDSSL